MTSVTFRQQHTIGNTTYEVGDTETNLSPQEVRQLIVSSIVSFTPRAKPTPQPSSVAKQITAALAEAKDYADSHTVEAGGVVDATTANKGIVKLATPSVATTGTDPSSAVTPVGVKAVADAEAAARDAAIQAEATARQAAVAAEASARAAAVNAEATSRDDAIDAAIAAEVAARNAAVSAEVAARNAAIAVEAGTRAAADTAEVSARNAAIDAGIATEALARTAAVTAEAGTRAAADEAEVTARNAAIDAALAAEVTARNAAVAAEASARSAADTAEVTARNTAIAQAVADLKGGVSGAYDTLVEIVARMTTDESGAASLTTLVNAIRDLSDTTHKTALDSAYKGIANLPPGSTVVVTKDSATGFWPASYTADGSPVYTGGANNAGVRPTVRADIVVQWKGPNPSPAIVSSGVNGMRTGIDTRLITT
jgi:hypothetical protein